MAGPKSRPQFSLLLLTTLFASSGQRYLLRTVGSVVGEGNVTGASAGLGWRKGNLDLASSTSGDRATIDARSDFLGLGDCRQSEVSADGDRSDTQGCISGVGKYDLLGRAGCAD